MNEPVQSTAYRRNPHNFGTPPPGSGGNSQVCRQCGEREVPTLNPECVGPRKATVDVTKHDYEPIL